MITIRFLPWSLVVSLSLAAFSVFGPVAVAGTCPDSVMALWSLEESESPYQDYLDSDSGNHAICASQCPTRISGGVVGAANRFQGTNTGLRVPGGEAFNWTGSDSFSVELWVRRTAAAGVQQVLIGRTNGVFSWNLSIESNGSISAFLDDSLDSITLNSSKTLSTSQSALAARWHHVALVRNGASGQTQLFVDGRSEASRSENFQNGFSADTASLAIGWSGDEGDARRFSGDLDEIAVYNRAIGATEIQSHYHLARHYCEMYDYPIDIMPLGNSITYDQLITETRSQGDRFAYRVDLWESLNDGLYWFDFIGSRSGGQNADPNFDPDNAGFPGMRPSELYHLMQTSYNQTCERYNLGDCYEDGANNTDIAYLRIYPADVILLHIGTNGLDSLGVIPDLVNDVENTLAEIDSYSPNITVLVARIIHNLEDTTSDDSLTHQYNNALEQMVNQRIAAGDKLKMIDMEDGAGIIYTQGVDMADHLHPLPSGYAKMAAQWYAGLDDFLPAAVLPAFTSSPIESVGAGRTYTYQVTASGTPKPTFTLEERPNGMTIEPDTGLITWTAPDTIGQEVDVSVAAQNIDPTQVSWASVARQNFTIAVTDGSDSPVNPPSVDENDSDGGGGGCFIQSSFSKGGFQPWKILILATIISLVGKYGIRRIGSRLLL